MKAGIIVGPRGVERIVSVGAGLNATADCLRLVDLLWQDIQAFDRAIRARIPAGPDGSDADPERLDAIS
jgi:hypothetical protein